MAPAVVFYYANCILTAVVSLCCRAMHQCISILLSVRLCLKCCCEHYITTAVVQPLTKIYACYSTAVVLNALQSMFCL